MRNKIVWSLIIIGLLQGVVRAEEGTGCGLKVSDLALGIYRSNYLYLNNALEDSVINKNSTPKWVYGVEFLGAGAVNTFWLGRGYQAVSYSEFSGGLGYFLFLGSMIAGIPFTAAVVNLTGQLLKQKGCAWKSMLGVVVGDIAVMGACLFLSDLGTPSYGDLTTLGKIGIGLCLTFPAIGAVIGYNWK